MSFLENENQMVIDAIYSEIGEMLVEDWVNSIVLDFNGV